MYTASPVAVQDLPSGRTRGRAGSEFIATAKIAAHMTTTRPAA